MISAKTCPTFPSLSAYVVSVLVHRVCYQLSTLFPKIWAAGQGGVQEGGVQETGVEETTSKDEDDKEEGGLVTQSQPHRVEESGCEEEEKTDDESDHSDQPSNKAAEEDGVPNSDDNDAVGAKALQTLDT